jgi:hypothetical protein
MEKSQDADMLHPRLPEITMESARDTELNHERKSAFGFLANQPTPLSQVFSGDKIAQEQERKQLSNSGKAV